MKISPTMGTLSGFVTMSRKFGSKTPNTKNAQAADDAVADGVGNDLLALPDDQEEPDHRESEEQTPDG